MTLLDLALAALAGLAIGFPLGWRSHGVRCHLDAGLRDELRAIDEERERD